MRRIILDYYLDDGVKGWIVRTAEKNHWRVASWIDLDDLIAEGYMAFAIANARYFDKAKNRSHFMSLFKRIYTNRIHDLAKKRSRTIDAGLAEIPISQLVRENEIGREFEALELLAGVIDGEAELLTTLRKAPPELWHLMKGMEEGALAKAPLPRRSLQNGQYVSRASRYAVRETDKEYFNRVLKTEGVSYEKIVRKLVFENE